MKIRAILGILAMALGGIASAHAAASENEPVQAPVEVMILATFHFANPGADVANMEIDDVLSSRRQREIEILADSLATWAPTRVAVEAQAGAPAFTLKDYADVESLLTSQRNETVQIGYRVAHTLGHTDVYGFDEQPSVGEPDYFPFGKVQAFAQENGQQHIMQNVINQVQTKAKEEQGKLSDRTIAQALLPDNDASAIDKAHDELYYSLLRVGDGDSQPGAELNAYWYMRNAKMFGKIDMIAKPGDRVLVVVGSGHANWLRHFIRRMPGYDLVDAQPYVRAAAIASEVTAEN